MAMFKLSHFSLNVKVIWRYYEALFDGSANTGVPSLSASSYRVAGSGG
jgi:hypothetical protein